MKSASLPKATYSVSEVATILGYSTNSIYTFLEKKKIKAIRMGKGRFKIPASEVERLLVGSKSSSTIKTPSVSVSDQTMHDLPSRTALGITDSMDEPLDIFPWFFSLTSIVSGVSLFIFSTSVEMMTQTGLSWLVWVVRFLFLIAGISGLWTLLVGNGNSRIRMLSYTCGVIAAFTLVGVSVLLGRPIGALLYGSFGISILCSFFLPGIRAFALHVLSFLFGIVVFGMFFPQMNGLEQLIPSGISLPVQQLSLLLFVCVVFSGVLYHLGKKYSRIVGLFGVAIMFFLFAALSVALAQHLSWVMSFVLLVTAVSMGIAIFWEPESLRRRSDKAVFTMTFLMIGSIFLLTIGVVHVISSSLLTTMADTLEDRVTYGKVVTVTAVDTVKSALEGTAQNTVFGDALGKKSVDILSAYSRGLIEGSRMIAEVHIVDTAGVILQSYPMEEDPQEEYERVREVVLESLSLGKSIAKTVVYSERGASEPHAWIAVPVYDSNRQIVGAISGDINIGELSDRLQRIGRSERGEYLEIIDSDGQMIVHPNFGDTGESQAHKQFTAVSGNGQNGFGKTIDERGEIVLQSADSVGRMNWGISAMAPVYSSMELMPVAPLVVSLVVVSTLLCIGMACMVRSVRRKVTIEGP